MSAWGGVVVVVFRPIKLLGGIPVVRKKKTVGKVQGTVARTWAELSRAVGVSERVLQRLGTRPDFPGRPAKPGKRDGLLPWRRSGPGWRRSGRRSRRWGTRRLRRLRGE